MVVGESQNDFAVYTTVATLDTTFGGTGIIFTDFAASFDMTNAMAIQPDGKIVAAGVTDAGGEGNNFALDRYRTNGTGYHLFCH